MALLLEIVFGLYFIMVTLLLIGWRSAQILPRRRKESSFISVIIPFRDEEKFIGNLINSLTRIDYPSDSFEVIFVNDHSSDFSVKNIESRISILPHFRLLDLPEGIEGKKQAITKGIESAKGEIIVTTDADCSVPVKWLSAINDQFAKADCRMVIGGVRIDGMNNTFSQLQALEFCSLIGVAGAMTKLGYPVLCNGANLSFLKSSFIEVHGYEGNLHVASGDDEFLMRKIISRFPGSIAFMGDPEAVVTTTPQRTLLDFIHQRLRWAGKWKYNSSWVSKLLAVFVVLFQVSWIAMIMVVCLGMVDPAIGLLMLGMKVILEYLFISVVGSFLRVGKNIFHFLLLQFVYPLYVIFSGFMSFFLPHQWKGRMN